MGGKEANSPSTNKNHGSSRLWFGSAAICFGSKLTNLNGGDLNVGGGYLNGSRQNLAGFRLLSVKSSQISTDLIEIWPALDEPHRDLVGVVFGERRSPVGSIGLCFHVKTCQLTRRIRVLKMKIHCQLSPVAGWVGFGLGWTVWIGGLGPRSGWIALAKGIWMK